MSQLCLYLPSFASDYSGACASLFDLDCIIVIHDAMCCSRNYTGFDEPRWSGAKRPIFCSGLRELDAILGDDEKLLRKIKNSYALLTDKPAFIALLASPSPAVIGSDMNGIARLVEEALGIPAIAFNTTGLKYYDAGIELAIKTLIKRFTAEPDTGKHGVNILGVTPLDYSDNSNAENIRKLLNGSGLETICTFSMMLSMDDIGRAASAAVNLVVSKSGIEPAQYMYKRWGIPYVVGTPMGTDSSRLIADLWQTAADGRNRVLNAGISGTDRVLIIADQIIGNSIRYRLCESYGVKSACVATFFGYCTDLALPGDIHIHSEEELCDILASDRFDIIVADPVMKEIPETEGKQFFELPHVAVSSKLYWHDYPVFCSEEFETFIRSVADTANGK